jgi:DNA repair protein SbcD/Mre11
MRFLHTGDWHVGKMLKGRSRQDEHEAVLAEIADIARRERVDVLLIGGDTFESVAPTPEAERLVYATLAECVGAEIAVVLIGGNHDHPRRLAALTRLLDRLSIFIRPEPCRPADGGVIELPSRDRSEVARIAVLPFVQEPRIVDACRLFDPEEQWYQAYADRVARMLAVLAREFQATTVNVLMAHLLVDGARVGGGERALHLGQIYAVTPPQLPGTAQYLALNHLHRPQRVATASWAEYSGSPLQLDFGEVDQAKRVVLVEAHPGRPVEVRSVPLAVGRPLLDVAGTVEELTARADRLRGGFMRVELRAPRPEPGLVARVKEILPDALEVRCVYTDAPAPPAPGNGGQQGETPPGGGLDPAARLRAYYRQTRGAELPDPVAALFTQLYEEALRETA